VSECSDKPRSKSSSWWPHASHQIVGITPSHLLISQPKV
jgi:hypothetical protein